MRTDRLTEEQRQYPFLGMPYWIGRGFGLNLSVVTDPAKSRQLFGPGGKGTFTWPGAYGTWWQADPSADLILLYLIQNHPDMSGDCRRRGRGQHFAGQTARRATEVRAAHIPSAEDLARTPGAHLIVAVAQPTVLISGAGIAGPSLAFWLTKNGYRVIVVEIARRHPSRWPDRRPTRRRRRRRRAHGADAADASARSRAARRRMGGVRRQPPRRDAGDRVRRQRAGVQVGDPARRSRRRALPGHQGFRRIPLQHEDFGAEPRRRRRRRHPGRRHEAARGPRRRRRRPALRGARHGVRTRGRVRQARSAATTHGSPHPTTSGSTAGT